MMTTQVATDVELFERHSSEQRRLLREEQFILNVSESLCIAMEQAGVSKAQLARRLGKSKGFVSQVLSGGRNLTLRTIADICDAIDARPSLSLDVNEAVGVLHSEWAPAEAWTYPKLVYSAHSSLTGVHERIPRECAEQGIEGVA